MSQYLTFLEAKEITDKTHDSKDHYISADFYRMQKAPEGAIALGIHDVPAKILYDIQNHGSDEALMMLAEAERCGYVAKVQRDGIEFLDVIDVEDVAGAPHHFRSHIAMQIGFPSRYKEYFKGEYVWTYSHPKMQQLIPLCISCCLNRQHPSDWNGFHEIGSDKRKPGRPKKEKQEKKEVPGFKEWVAACQQYKIDLKEAWDRYMDLCQQRKAETNQAHEWQKDQRNKIEAEHRERCEELREMRKQATQEYEAKLEELRTQVHNGLKGRFDSEIEHALQVHSELKAQGKPQREDYG